MEKRILDEETRRQLLGYTPFSGEQSIPFTPDGFPNVKEEFKPVFSIRPFSQAELSQLRNNLSNNKSDDNEKIIRSCIVGWVNFFNSGTGEEIGYRSAPQGGVDKELYQILPSAIQVSITKFIKKISGLSTMEELGLR
jgi:hypothetical protein